MSEPHRDNTTGVCSECASPPEAYHARSCSLFTGYYCHKCEGRYFGEYCPDCPAPWWVDALGQPQ